MPVFHPTVGRNEDLWGKLDFGRGRRQRSRRANRLECDLAVGAVTEGLVLRGAAAAQANGLAAAQIEWIAVHVVNGELALNADRVVIADGDFCWHSFDRSRSHEKSIMRGNT